MAWILSTPFSSVTMDVIKDMRDGFTKEPIDYRDFYVTGRLFELNGCVLTAGYFGDDGKLSGFMYGFIDPIYKDFHVKMIAFSSYVRGNIKFKAFKELRSIFDFMIKSMGIRTVWAVTERGKAYNYLFKAGEIHENNLLVYNGGR